MNESEELLIRISELEAANRKLEQTQKILNVRTTLAWMGMAANVWQHSFRNNAIAIRDCVHLLRHYLMMQDKADKCDELLNRIDILVDRMLEKHLPLPEMAEEGGVEVISVNALLSNLVTRMLDLTPSREISLQWELQDNPLPVVSASREWLDRAIRILIENSLQAMSKSTTKVLKIVSMSDNDVVKILVSDTGCGVPEKLLPKILNEAIITTQKKTGLGIGLLLADTIIHSFGGTVKLENTGPGGTTFSIILANARHLPSKNG